jgi:hypothetical protein
MSKRHGIKIPCSNGESLFQIADKKLKVTGLEQAEEVLLGTGYNFTPAGAEIMELISSEANQKYLDIFLKAHNLLHSKVRISVCN